MTHNQAGSSVRKKEPGRYALHLVSFLMISFLPAMGSAAELQWEELPPLPNADGVAGPFVGVHQDALIVAGGANFPEPVWESQKEWHDDIFVLVRELRHGNENYHWETGFKLERPLAYGASVSTPYGVLCVGGNDAQNTYADVFLLRWNATDKTIEQEQLPCLPRPCAFTGAALIGNTVYVAGGAAGAALESAMRNFWSLDLSKIGSDTLTWRETLPWPGASRAFSIVTAQHNGTHDCLYIISGRRQEAVGDVEFLTDVYEFNPARYDSAAYDPATGAYTAGGEPWRRRADVPRCVMAGVGIALGQSHLLILGGADGSLFHQADMLKDAHPGFPKKALAYHTITNTWVDAGPMPANHVTTTAVRWGDDSANAPIIIPSGEIRPRVRTPRIWRIRPAQSGGHFGVVNFAVLGLYLAVMIGMGVFFAFRNKVADDFFRGGQRVPWFVAGMSIFATMLSSITFMAIPAKTYATDWVYFLVNMMAVA
ncbi:MAG TPA: sodium:solute symporter, partial [Candidatus Hydrogenedentes bacterium]|nr:sodium:solute symporter [Candidatus Hydrogenedentota bacterium]